jgi:hypothetical protein
LNVFDGFNHVVFYLEKITWTSISSGLIAIIGLILFYERLKNQGEQVRIQGKQVQIQGEQITSSEILASAPANATLSLESFWLSLFCLNVLNA